MGGFAIAMDVKKYPFVMFFAEDDSYIQSKFSYELADLMGIQDNNIYHFTGQLQKGTHFLLKLHGVVHVEVY